ncbi:6990_t:CDS:1, partial [Entrophospora sp. SA101]
NSHPPSLQQYHIQVTNESSFSNIISSMMKRYVAKSLQHSGFARTFRKYLDNHDKRMIVEHVLYENGIGLLDDIDSYLEII